MGNKLKTDYVITNNGDNIMPFGVGGHEGYYCPEGIENISGICFGANFIKIIVCLLQIQIGVCRAV
ncbi:MAG: hypothetical protein II998_04100 [Clostridia bacterium]|nr:hypothetical protein [Clostridia bacterium]